MDCIIDAKESLFAFHVHGHNSTIAQTIYFKNFHKPKGIPLLEMAKAQFQFHTNSQRAGKYLLTELIKTAM